MNENNQTPIGQMPATNLPDISGPSPNQPISATPDPIPGAAADTSKPKKGGSTGRMMMIVLVLVLVAATGFGGYSYGKSKAPTKIVTKTIAPAGLTVPQGATVISKCAKGKGALYALPKDIPTGPVYMVNGGKVIGLEFMVGKDDLLVAGKSFLNLPTFSQEYDHVNIGLLSQGHAGFPVPHYHVDVFTVKDSVASAITCTT